MKGNSFLQKSKLRRHQVLELLLTLSLFLFCLSARPIVALKQVLPAAMYREWQVQEVLLDISWGILYLLGNLFALQQAPKEERRKTMLILFILVVIALLLKFV